MAVSGLVRNLRDGELVIKDASDPPNMLTVVLDEGDLNWVERQRTIEVKDRGSIQNGHTRRGDEESVAVSFTAKWTQLLGRSVSAEDPLQLYEMLMFKSGSGLTSTSALGEQNTLRLEFTVRDPAGEAHEKIAFAKVYREQLTMSEGADYNLIAFRGRDFEVSPSIDRA